MLAAIIAGIVTLVLVIVVAVLVARRMGNRSRDKVATSREIHSIDTYGVAPEKHKTGFGTSGHTEVSTSKTASGSTGEAITSRFVTMGIMAAAVFGSLIAKLFSMQVLQSDEYSSQASQNLYSTVYTPAPRGVIYDCDGLALVSNRSNYTVLASSDVASDYDTVRRLSALLGIPFQVVRQRILDSTSGAQSMRVVASDVTLRNIAFISEHASAFPNVTCEMRTSRSYPYGALAAHILGYTGTASSEDFENETAGQNLQSGDSVGKSGVEYTYENLLSGDHGTRTLLTDAQGNVQSVVSETAPLRGNDIYLTIRGPVQKVADDTLREYLAPDGRLGSANATGGAVVCLDATNGEVVAMASYPTFTPESFIGGISQDMWDEFNTEESHYPLMDRAVAGTYPAASTFKAFTSMAALTNGVASSSSDWTCTGTWTGFGSSYAQKCWKTAGHGTLNLVDGIANSCDVVFYEIAKNFYESGTLSETAMQDYICEYGFGAKTGIDLSGEATGRVPTPTWKSEYFKDAPEEAVWQGGDMTNMAIGQGYVLITPLQNAAAYCGIATGKVYRPHVLREVRNSLGETVLKYEPEVIAEPTMSAEHIATVREGLRKVMTLNNYDSNYFSGCGFEMAGKTGTAEVSGKKDYSWFCCYAPYDNPKYVCACLAEQGVSAANNCIPIVSEVLQAAIAYDNGSLTADSMGTVTGAYTVVESSSTDTTSSRGD